MATAERITNALKTVLPHAVNVVDASQDGDWFTVTVETKVAPSTDFVAHELTLVWVGEGWPKDVAAALNGSRTPTAIVGAHFSPGSRELANTKGVGWLDETGAAEIVTPSGLVVSRTGIERRPDKTEPKWSAGTLAAAESILSGVPATVDATIGATGLATGTCVRALKTLTDLGLLSQSATRGRNSTRRIDDLEQFIVAYREAASRHRSRLPASFSHVVWRDALTHVRTMGEVWNDQGIEWAATGSLAASVVAPYLTSVGVVEIYVDQTTALELQNAARMVDGTPAEPEASRLVLRPFPTTTSQRHRTIHDGLSVVPPARIYSDLFEVGVRGGEAAEHLREVTSLGRTS